MSFSPNNSSYAIPCNDIIACLTCAKAQEIVPQVLKHVVKLSCFFEFEPAKSFFVTKLKLNKDFSCLSQTNEFSKKLLNLSRVFPSRGPNTSPGPGFRAEVGLLHLITYSSGYRPLLRGSQVLPKNQVNKDV